MGVGERESPLATKIHFRRCHFCGETTEVQNGLVDHCCGCGKVLAPFYYFDESREMGLKSEAQYQSEYKSSALPFREYPPIWGLTAYWDEAVGK